MDVDRLESLAQDFACAIEALARWQARANQAPLSLSDEQKRIHTKRAAVQLLLLLCAEAIKEPPAMLDGAGNDIEQ